VIEELTKDETKTSQELEEARARITPRPTPPQFAKLVSVLHQFFNTLGAVPRLLSLVDQLVKYALLPFSYRRFR
jgi:hypothetical protein